MVGWPVIVGPGGWQASRLAGWLAGWLVVWLAGWLAGGGRLRLVVWLAAGCCFLGGAPHKTFGLPGSFFFKQTKYTAYQTALSHIALDIDGEVVQHFPPNNQISYDGYVVGKVKPWDAMHVYHDANSNPLSSADTKLQSLLARRVASPS